MYSSPLHRSAKYFPLLNLKESVCLALQKFTLRQMFTFWGCLQNLCCAVVVLCTHGEFEYHSLKANGCAFFAYRAFQLQRPMSRRFFHGYSGVPEKKAGLSLFFIFFHRFPVPVVSWSWSTNDFHILAFCSFKNVSNYLKKNLFTMLRAHLSNFSNFTCSWKKIFPIHCCIYQIVKKKKTLFTSTSSSLFIHVQPPIFELNVTVETLAFAWSAAGLHTHRMMRCHLD